MFDLQLPRLKAGETDKLNRVNWHAGLSILAYGVRVGVRSDDARMMEKLLPHLPPGWKISKASVDRLYSLLVKRKASRRSLHELYANGERLGEHASVDELLNFFESDLQLYVAEHAPHRIFVHAGVVGWKGRAIVIPGRSYSGKTTLVAALVKAGATYYSDEYAVLDSSGLVHPYPRKLGIREGSGTVRTRKYAVEEIGGRSGSKALPIGLVLVGQYREGARFRPRPMSAGEAVLALLSHTVSARRQPQRALATLKKVVDKALAVQGRRGEAGEMIAEALRLCHCRQPDLF